MKNENPFVSFLGGIVIGLGVLALAQTIWPTGFVLYQDGVRATRQDAYEHGFMTKEVNKEDKVVYKWKESQ